MGKSLIIREGRRKDAVDVLRLIKELAKYEKALGEVEITEKTLIKDGFNKNPAFRVLVAELNGEVVGLALYYFKYSTWKGKCLFLEDLIVSEKYRRQKVGSMLFEALIKISKNLKVKRMEWQVLNWNEPAINFYKKYNAIFDNGWVNVKLVYPQIQKFKKID